MSLIDKNKAIEELETVSKGYYHFTIQFVNDCDAYNRVIKKLKRKGLNGEVSTREDPPVDHEMRGTNFFISFPGRRNLLSVLEGEESYYVVCAKRDKRGLKSRQIFEYSLGERVLGE